MSKFKPEPWRTVDCVATNTRFAFLKSKIVGWSCVKKYDFVFSLHFKDGYKMTFKLWSREGHDLKKELEGLRPSENKI